MSKHKELIEKLAASGDIPSLDDVYSHYEFTAIECCEGEKPSKRAMLGVSLAVLNFLDELIELRKQVEEANP